MQVRRSIILLVAVVVALIALMLWRGRKQPGEAPPAAAVQTNVAPATASVPSVPAVSAPIHTNIPKANLPPPATNASTPLPKSDAERMQEVLSNYNDVPIVFYGKIEDQFSNAVSNALVNFGVRVMNGYESTVKSGQVVSDASGFFTISGYKGQDLGLGVQKTGYVFVSMNGSGIYSKLGPEEERAHPDPNNPTVIKMWKLQGAEPLIHFSFQTRIPCDGSPISFNLRSGQVVNSDGDLIIRLQSPAELNTSQQYDWQAFIAPVNGGIVSADYSLEKRFEAPEAGYASEFDIKNIKDVRPWSSAFHGGFYFKSQGGRSFGKLDLGIVVYASRNGLVPITIDGYINPSGSRNLEIDPAKVVEAHP